LCSATSSHAQELFGRVVLLSETHPKQHELPPFDLTVAYEYIPLKKVCSVSSDATAFRSRGPQPNIVVVVSWEKENQDSPNVDNARSISQELIKIIESTAERQPTQDENEGYMNYGMCETRNMPCEPNTRICQNLTYPTC
jgi:hypothetical protein